LGVEVTSLGNRTDLALLELGGSEIEDYGDHLVVRSPHNPTYWWGNFLLLDHTPASSDIDRWMDRFATALPEAKHRAFAVDGTDGTLADLDGFAERGLSVEASTVMTATSVRPPERPNRDATYRQLGSDDDWAQCLELRIACNDTDEIGYEQFAARKVATERATVEAGHGGWFGAFLDGRLVAQMGLLAASPGLARFQTVETHPDLRGRGLAGTLVHHTSRYGFDELGARILVMVADPEYLAIRIYRSVGFAATETQLQAELPPA
jgi:ribosomal protein S18 acetylase RimI-like enzyme